MWICKYYKSDFYYLYDNSLPCKTNYLFLCEYSLAQLSVHGCVCEYPPTQVLVHHYRLYNKCHTPSYIILMKPITRCLI